MSNHWPHDPRTMPPPRWRPPPRERSTAIIVLIVAILVAAPVMLCVITSVALYRP
jgi:hypothetical protein